MLRVLDVRLYSLQIKEGPVSPLGDSLKFRENSVIKHRTFSGNKTRRVPC